jgi:hypothetical protein
MPNFSNDPTLTGVLDPTEVLTLYNLNSAKRSVYSSSQIDRNSSSDNATYNGIETSVSARLPRGINAFGGWTAERNVSKFCESDDDPNGINTADLYIGENVSSGGRFCDQGAFSVPFRHEFKAAGNVPLVYGIEFGTILQSYPGQQRIITWAPAANVFPAALRTNSETIILNKPGSVYQPRWTQWDVNLKKNFRYGKKILTGQIDVFNVLNSNSIWSTNDQIGNSLGQVQSIQPGRMPRLVFQMRW